MITGIRIVPASDMKTPPRTPEGGNQPGAVEFALFAVDSEDRPIGWGVLCLEAHGLSLSPGTRFADIWVSVGVRRMGVGRELVERLLDHAKRAGVTSVVATYKAVEAGADTLAKEFGFEPDYQMLELSLELDGYDLGPWQSLLTRLERQGVRFTTLAAEADRGAMERAIWELDYQVSADVLEWSGEVVPLERYRAENLAGEGFVPEGVIIAWLGERMVGFSGTKVESENTGYTWFLGVKRQWRKLGIAQAMKVLTIAWAQSQGLTRLDPQ